jgi:hypothetical protein
VVISRALKPARFPRDQGSARFPCNRSGELGFAWLTSRQPYWPKIARSNITRSGDSSRTVPSDRTIISSRLCLSIPSQRREGLKRSVNQSDPSGRTSTLVDKVVPVRGRAGPGIPSAANSSNEVTRKVADAKTRRRDGWLCKLIGRPISNRRGLFNGSAITLKPRKMPFLESELASPTLRIGVMRTSIANRNWSSRNSKRPLTGAQGSVCAAGSQTARAVAKAPPPGRRLPGWLALSLNRHRCRQGLPPLLVRHLCRERRLDNAASLVPGPRLPLTCQVPSTSNWGF